MSEKLVVVKSSAIVSIAYQGQSFSIQIDGLSVADYVLRHRPVGRKLRRLSPPVGRHEAIRNRANLHVIIKIVSLAVSAGFIGYSLVACGVVFVGAWIDSRGR